jgi:hypothetical protein
MVYQAFFNHILQTSSQKDSASGYSLELQLQKGSKQEKSDEALLSIKKYILVINNNTVF